MRNGKDGLDRLYTRRSIGAIGGRIGARMMVVAALLALGACAEKDSAFFAPATGDGSGIPVPEAVDLDGTWSVTYEEVFTTCQSAQPDFTADATLVASGTGADFLAVTVEDAAEPIVGPYDSRDGDFVGATDPESAGDQEEWDVRFRFGARDVPEMSGSSVLTLFSDGLALCERRFDIAGTLVTPVPL